MARGGLVEVFLECDACRHTSKVTGKTLEDVKARIVEAGWLSNAARDLDVCPACYVNRVLAVGRQVSRVLL